MQVQQHSRICSRCTGRAGAVVHLRPSLRPVATVHSFKGSSQGQQDASRPFISEEAKQKAAEAAGKAVSELQGMADRAWRKIDSEHQVTDKMSRAARKLEEQARDVDQTYNVRRRIRSSVDHVQRMWPVWSAQLDSFAATPLGKGTLLVAILLLISSPIFWSVLNFFLILWWLAIPIGAALINAAQRKTAERMASEAQERQARNPFSDMFAGRTTASNPFTGSTRRYDPPAGPVIDADFVVLNEDDSSKKK